jgi:FAD dependent oxidoreductase
VYFFFINKEYRDDIASLNANDTNFTNYTKVSLKGRMDIVRTEKYDVAIVGGGLSGVCAAITCRRKGARTLLVEKYGFLGGMTSAAFFTPWYDLPTMVDRTPGSLILQKLRSLGGSRPVGSSLAVDPEILKALLQELVLDAGVDILLHSHCIGVERNAGSLHSLFLMCKEGGVRVEASAYLDATGVGAVTAFGGAPCILHRSSVSFRFTMRVGHEVQPTAAELKELSDRWYARHPMLVCRQIEIAPAARPGEVTVGMIDFSDVDATRSESLTRAELQTHELVRAAGNFLKSESPSLQGAEILSTPPQIGFHAVRQVQGRAPIVDGGQLNSAAIGAGQCDDAMRIPEIDNLFVTGCSILPPELLSSTNNPGASMLLGERGGVLAISSRT